MAKTPGNIVVSPLSVLIATAMLDAAAEGETRTEIATAARFGVPETALHDELRALLDELTTRVNHWAELSLANGLWVDRSCSMAPSYQALLERSYDAIADTLELGAQPDESCARINQFVAERTRGKITSVVDPKTVTEATRLVLANVLYFLGAWEHRFREGDTKTEPFHPEPGKAVSVPMMHKELDTRYHEDDVAQVAMVPYQGSGLAMVLVLPRRSRTLRSVEEGLSPAQVSEWLRGMERRGVDVAIPRFEVSSEVNLIPLLRTQGIKRVFTPGSAELPGVCDDPETFVGLASHYATLGITEGGTEAAAATVYKMTMGLDDAPPEVVAFRADRPFLFIVGDVERGTVLFMGRYAGPGN
ncbi:MAG: serpin family protein [Candidatus Eisenbacteria bacterium]|nr:serpin family protein [Candidatus Eisenbacteria bacterium]